MSAIIKAEERGFTLLEVLITVVILAFGLLGLANLQAKLHMTEMEAYQRAQAVVLLQDMSNRLQVAGRVNAPNYSTGTTTPLGTASPNTLVDCGGMTGATRDRCEWGNLLKGRAETRADDGDAATDEKAGVMIGARGCIEQIVAPNNTAGVCAAGVYRVTVAWQGLFETTAPVLACGQNLYGNESLRRVASATVMVGVPKCI